MRNIMVDNTTSFQGSDGEGNPVSEEHDSS